MSGFAEAGVIATNAAARFDPGKAWRTVAILFLLAVAAYLDRMVISMLVEPIKQALNLTDTQFSLAQGVAFAAAFALFAVPLGMAIDRYSRRHVVFVCVLIWAVGCIGAGFANGVASLIAARMLVGVGEAVVAPAAASLISDNFPADRAGAAFGIFGASSYVGFGVSMAVGGALISYLGETGGLHLPLLGFLVPWRATFVLTGAPALLLAFLAFLLHDQRHSATRASPPAPVGWADLWRTRRAPLAAWLVGVGALSGAFSTVTAWTPAYLIRKFDLPPAEIGIVLGVGMGVLAALGSVVAGLVIGRMTRSGTTNATFIVGIAIGLVSGPLFVAAHLVANVNLAILLLELGLLVFGGMAAVSYGAIQAIAPPGARGKVASLITLTAALLSYALAPLLVALVTDHVLHDTNQVGLSLAIVQTIFVVIGVGGFAAGLGPLRRISSV